MSETGVVKFRCEHRGARLEPFPGFEELNACRRQLLQLRMIGVDPDGIGYGNLSVRAGDGSGFYITASGTGGQAELELDDYSKVTAWDFAANSLQCEGRAVASSESLTHAAIYECGPEIGAVAHCHDAKLWRDLAQGLPSTSAVAEYGTPAMALEVQRLLGMTAIREAKVFAMAGHSGGVVAFGKDIVATLATLLRRRHGEP